MPRSKGRKRLWHVKERVRGSAEQLEVLLRGLLLRGKEERGLVLGELVDERRLAHAAPAIDDRHLEAVLVVHALERVEFPLACDEHGAPDLQDDFLRTT